MNKIFGILLITGKWSRYLGVLFFFSCRNLHTGMCVKEMFRRKQCLNATAEFLIVDFFINMLRSDSLKVSSFFSRFFSSLVYFSLRKLLFWEVITESVSCKDWTSVFDRILHVHGPSLKATIYVKFEKAAKVLIRLQFKYLLFLLKQIISMIEN